ncbi:hypothetical protein [Streptomyces sp. NPDC002403]
MGGHDLSGFAEAAAEAIQHHVRARPVEGVFGVAGEGGGVGAQGLGEIGVAFDRGPGGRQGVKRLCSVLGIARSSFRYWRRTAADRAARQAAGTRPRDFRRFDREIHADLANPWLIRAQQAARALGEALGRSRWITGDVNRALVTVLSGFREGESIPYSELFTALGVRGLPVVRIAEVLDRLGLFTDDRAPPPTGGWSENSAGCLRESIAPSKPGSALSSTVARGPSLAPGPQHGPAWARPSRWCWSGTAATTTCESTREDIIAVRNAVTGKQSASRIVALRSPLRHAKNNGQIFRNPTIRIRVPRQTGGVLQALVQADIDEAIATASTPDIRLIRPGRRPLDDLTRRAVLHWLDHRRSRWPNTANPHLLITRKTAVELGPAGKLWTTRATRNLTAALERLRVDRQLEEALTHGADPLHVALVFRIGRQILRRSRPPRLDLLHRRQPAPDPRSARHLPGVRHRFPPLPALGRRRQAQRQAAHSLDLPAVRLPRRLERIDDAVRPDGAGESAVRNTSRSGHRWGGPKSSQQPRRTRAASCRVVQTRGRSDHCRPDPAHPA